MQVNIGISFAGLMFTGLIQQKPVVLATFDNCKVVRQGDLVAVVIDTKTVWKTKASGDIQIRQDHRTKRFFISIGGGGLTLFGPNGSVVREIPYSAYRDPRPLLFYPPYIVFGDGVYNWTKFNQHGLEFQNKSRSTHIVEMNSGKFYSIRKYRAYGLPLTVWRSELWLISPYNWQKSLRSHGATAFWVTRLNLVSKAVHRQRIQVNKITGRNIWGAIVGWGSLDVHFDPKSRQVDLVFSSKPVAAFTLPWKLSQ